MKTLPSAADVLLFVRSFDVPTRRKSPPLPPYQFPLHRGDSFYYAAPGDELVFGSAAKRATRKKRKPRLNATENVFFLEEIKNTLKETTTSGQTIYRNAFEK